MSSTRGTSKSRKKAAPMQPADLASAAIEGAANIIGSHSKAMHIAGNVYVCLHPLPAPPEQLQLTDAEREIVKHYRAANVKAKSAIRRVAEMAAGLNKQKLQGGLL